MSIRHSSFRVLCVVACLTSAAPALAQRLPGNTVPEHYDLAVAPNLAAATFTGDEVIKVRLTKPSTAIVLNAAEIAFDTVSVRAGGRVQTATVSLDAANEQATFTVPQPIAAGPAEIAVKYRGILNDQLRGLYLSQANNRRYAVTQLEATDARRMFPSFDEPAMKATFTLTATIDTGDHAISNGAVVSDTPGPSAGKHTVRFETTPVMSTYLVALAVGDFECISGGADGVPIRICSTPDKKRLTGFALESAQEILKYYNRYYAVRYPFKKLDVVAVPDFAAGAMENTGAIFYRESFLLADPVSASIDVRKRVAVVLAHEMAHQWFGDLVTMKWWDDIWLNEGFANWMETKPVRAWKPEWHLELDEVRSNQSAMALDSLKSTRAIRSKASTPAEINELFDAIAYEKGAAVLRMVEGWLGEEEFRTGVNAYINKFKYGNATAEDFWGTLTAATRKPVDRVMAAFVDKPRVPIVTTGVQCAGSTGTAVVSQEAADGQALPIWAIPICVKSSTGKITCDVMEKETAQVPLGACPAWVMSNANGRGYYRMVYTPEALKKLAAAVGELSPAERIALISDEWALVRAGRLDIGSFLDLASGFRGEREPVVMATLAGPLATIGSDVVTDGSRDRYAAWVSALLKPALDEVGWNGPQTESDDRRALRATVVRTLGGTGRDPQVIARARDVVLGELATPGSVTGSLLDAVVPIAARNGDADLYAKYLARSRSAKDPEEHYRYVNALTAFSDPALAKQTFDYILGPDVRSQDAKLQLAGLLTNGATQSLAWAMTKARWDEVQKKAGEFGNTIIVGALASFCDAKAQQDITDFFATHKVPDAERTLQQSLERIGACVSLHEAQYQKLSAWLTANR